MSKLQSGFTLVELMVVVVIIGLLSSVAIPAYNDYSVRSRFSEVMSFAVTVRTTMAEEYLSKGSFPPAAADVITFLRNGFANSTYVNSAADVVYAPGNPAGFTVTLSNLGGSANGDTIVYSFTGTANGVSMSCAGGTLDANYRTAECR